MMSESEIITTAGVLLKMLRPGDVFSKNHYDHFKKLLSTLPLPQMLAIEAGLRYRSPSCDDESSHRHKHHAVALGFEYSIAGAKFKGENIMVTLQPGQSVSVKVNPLKDDPNNPGQLIPGDATLSQGSGASSDSTVFSLTMDPTDPTGSTATLTAVATSDAQATLSWSSLATETAANGGSSHQVSGSDQIFVSVGPPAPGLTTSLGFTYGTPSAKRK